jgi:hypothetical protein
MPQVFWIGQHSQAARQLEASVRQLAALEPRLPCAPTGAAFFEDNWRPTVDDLMAFLQKAIALGLPAASFSEWDHLALEGDESYNVAHWDFSEHWQVVADMAWAAPAREAAPEAAPAAPERLAVEEPVPGLGRDLEAEDELPEWLQFLDQPQAAFAEEAHEPGDLRDLEPEDELPEWLQFLNAPAQAEAPEPTPVIELGRTLEAEDELPEWLQFLNEPALREEGLAPESGLLRDLEPEDELPEWLQFLNQPSAEAPRALPAAVVTPPAPETLPEWLQQPALDLARAVTPERPPDLPTPVTEPLPDWLKQPAAELARAVAPGGLETHRDVSEAIDLLGGLEPEDELPAWLQFLNAPQAETAESELPPVEAGATPEPGAATPPSREPVPDWLQQSAAELARALAPESEPMLPTPVTEPLPDWLKQPAVELARAVVPEPLAPAETDLLRELEPESELPEWLQFLHQPGAQPERVEAAAPMVGAPAAVAPAPAPPALAQEDPVHEFFDAMRSGNVEAVTTYYGPRFAFVSRNTVMQDLAAVAHFYRSLLGRLDPRTLRLLSLRGSRAAISVRWAARGQDGSRLQGTDTFHLNRDGLIVYHQTALPG